jgi:hypothetical protein
MTTNLFALPSSGQHIHEDDQGLYYILNQETGQVRTILQLVFEQNQFYMFQLQPIADGLDYRWAVLSQHEACAMHKASNKQVAHYFSKPEYAEPVGAWEVVKNHDFGFAKFTPLDNPREVAFAVLTFEGEEMKAPIRLHKAPAEWLAEELAMPEEAVEPEAAVV